MADLIRRCFGEALGTFALLFVGTGAVIVNDLTDGSVSHVGVSLAFGLTVMAMIYAVGDVSGAHLNPAVTLGFWVASRLPGRDVLPYVLSQSVGAIAASLLLRGLFPTHGGWGVTVPSITLLRAFVVEAVLTFFLMFVIIHVSVGAKERGLMAGVAVGAAVSLSALFAGPVTGASMNPARSLAPAVVSGQLRHLWVYLMAPPIGAVLAALSCRVVRGSDCCVEAA
ncbi:MAG: MIP/aquaporin family protein [Anaerolineae bacterium]